MKCLVVGASVSSGYGLDGFRKDPHLFATKFLNYIDGVDPQHIDNMGNPGDDNLQIYRSALTGLMQNDYHSLLVVWQSIPFTNTHFGLELYSTRCGLISPVVPVSDINMVNKQIIPRSALVNMQKHLLAYYNHHWDIINLLFYCNSLIHVGKSTDTQIRFVHYNLPWRANRYFDQHEWQTPTELDPFTQEILQCDERDDEESKKLYKHIHKEYDNVGGMQSSYWMNLYNPMCDMKTDTTADGLHPGYKSQEIFTEFLIQCYSESLTESTDTV
tara:strand:+ start:216 stop:1031 length:816 start_codon:yes stop_codon:yes gene_type:complete